MKNKRQAWVGWDSPTPNPLPSGRGHFPLCQTPTALTSPPRGRGGRVCEHMPNIASPPPGLQGASHEPGVWTALAAASPSLA